MNSQDDAAGSIGPEPSDAASEPARVSAVSRHQAPWAGGIALPAGPGAPGAGRTVLSRWLQGHAPSGVIDDAQLVVTELITNSLEHAGVSPDDELGLSIELGYGWVRIEVEDFGDGGLIASWRSGAPFARGAHACGQSSPGRPTRSSTPPRRRERCV